MNIDNFLYTEKEVKGWHIFWWSPRSPTSLALARTRSAGYRSEPIVLQGPNQSEHSNYAPHHDEEPVEKILASLKRYADKHAKVSPAQVMSELDDEPDVVLSKNPNCDNVRKAIQRAKKRNLLLNPTDLSDLRDIRFLNRF